jgi:hypothetical protein
MTGHELIPGTTQVSLAGKFVGVIPPAACQQLGYLKRLLLMFERIALDFGSGKLSIVERRILESAKNELNYLSGEGLLTTLTALAPSGADQPFRGTQTSGEDLIAAGIGATKARLLVGRMNEMAWVAMADLRQTASKLREVYGVDAVAVPTELEPANADAAADRHTVVRIALAEFPTPSDTTPWEDIKEFRKDETARQEFARLKQWVNKTAKAGLKQYEVVDELRSLLTDYAATMHLHKIASHQGVIEVLVTTTAEVAEDLVKFKWSGAAKSIFNVRKHHLKLLQEESTASGREVAYILTARRKFSEF